MMSRLILSLITFSFVCSNISASICHCELVATQNHLTLEDQNMDVCSQWYDYVNCSRPCHSEKKIESENPITATLCGMSSSAPAPLSNVKANSAPDWVSPGKQKVFPVNLSSRVKRQNDCMQQHNCIFNKNVSGGILNWKQVLCKQWLDYTDCIVNHCTDQYANNFEQLIAKINMVHPKIVKLCENHSQRHKRWGAPTTHFGYYPLTVLPTQIDVRFPSHTPLHSLWLHSRGQFRIRSLHKFVFGADRSVLWHPRRQSLWKSGANLLKTSHIWTQIAIII
ncbi:hypothetical protein Ddc_20558 [Ditylenchus destructor]|nr:hypothetical protein Ddc_20558 [Ditylenchus destructor]